jgi:hypothetical protein
MIWDNPVGTAMGFRLKGKFLAGAGTGTGTGTSKPQLVMRSRKVEPQYHISSWHCS